MGFGDHVRRGHPILFSLIIFFGIIEGSIATWLTVMYDAQANYPSLDVRDRTRFILFTSWWTVLGSIILGLLFWHSSAGSILTSVASHLAFLILTFIFWTAAAGSITTALGGGNICSKLTVDLVYCNQLNALLGFAWVEWILIAFVLVIVVLRGISALRRGDGFGGQLV